MPTYTQLQREPWWGAELVPPALATLSANIRTFYRLGVTSTGTKGDNAHLSGYHRSRAWLQNSAYCTNRKYSVTETPGNRSGGDSNWISALDLAVSNSILLPMCQRLDAAVRSGSMEKVTEWYGNDDGDNRVDGYNNIENRIATSDSSHLRHLHVSFNRGRVNEDHTDLFQVLTGTGPWEGDMALRDDIDFYFLIYRVAGLKAMQDPIIIPKNTAFGMTADVAEPNLLAQYLRTIGKVTLSPEELALIQQAAEKGAEGGAPTYEELVAAAQEGANLAEDS